MDYQCCFCGKFIETEEYCALSIRKIRPGEPEPAEQELFCHEACLEKALSDAKLLYLKYL